MACSLGEVIVLDLQNEEATKQAIIRKFIEIVDKYESNVVLLKQKEDEQKALVAAGENAIAAGNLFGFNVIEEANKHRSADSRVNTPMPMQTSKSIKLSILELAAASHPNPVRASTLKAQMESIRGEKLHDKTIGMTLYRLSKEGLMKRIGWDWFYVPPKKNSAPEVGADNEIDDLV